MAELVNGILGTNYRWDGESGRWISAEHQRIAEIINDYNSDMSLAWIPPDKRGPEDKGLYYALVHRTPDGEEYVVRLLREDQINESLIEWIFVNDTTKNDPYEALLAKERAQEIMDMKRQMDEAEERADLAKAILRSPLHTYRHDGKVIRG